MEILKILKEYKNIIYSVIVSFEQENEMLENIIKEIYTHRFDIKEDTDIKTFIKNVSIYSIVINMDIEKRKELIKLLKIKTEIDLGDEDLAYELIKRNYNKIDKGESEINYPVELESIIENYFYNIKKQRRRKYTRCIIPIGIIGICIGFIISPHYAYILTPIGGVFNSIHNDLFNINTQEQEIMLESQLKDLKYYESAIDLVHEMSNTLIVAENNNAKYGLVEVTNATIDIAISSVRENLGDKKLEKMLLKWKDGDFNNATIVHNYVWELLDGEVGYAIAVDENAVEKVLLNMQNQK